MEEWKELDFLGYPNYAVSTLGRVLGPRKLLRPSKDTAGYLIVNLSAGEKKSFHVHRLIALAFIPNPEDLPQVNHKDLDKANCRVDNLEWTTVSGNIQHAHDNGAFYRSPNQSHFRR